MAKPFIRKAQVDVYMGGDKLSTLRASTFSFERNATLIADGVLGEPRDRLDSVTNYFSCSIDTLLEDLGLVKSLLDDIANKDAQVLPIDKTITMRVYPRDGSSATLVVQNAEIDNWKVAVSGRTSGVKLTLPFRAEDVKPLAGV